MSDFEADQRRVETLMQHVHDWEARAARLSQPVDGTVSATNAFIVNTLLNCVRDVRETLTGNRRPQVPSVALPTPNPDVVVDRAARYVQELAEVERVIVERRGERNAEHVGDPLHEVVGALLDESKSENRYWGGVDMADRITVDVLARAISGEATVSDTEKRHAQRVVNRLAEELGWPP